MASSRAPRGLKTRGKELWKRLDVEANSPAGVLAEEACRMADLIDETFQLIDGDHDEELVRQSHYKMSELFNEEDLRDIYLTVRLPNSIPELRQNQSTLRQLIMSVIGIQDHESKQLKSRTTPSPHHSSKEASPVVDEFTNRRKGRRTA